MTHHPAHYGELARLRHAESLRAARRQPVADAVPEERRARFSTLRQLFERRRAKPAPARPAHVG